MKTRNIIFKSLLPILLVLTMVNCKRDDISPSKTPSKLIAVNRLIYRDMKEIYLWNNHLPVVEPDSFKSSDGLLDSLMFKPIDKWSYVTTITEMNQFFELGEYVGHGFSIGIDAEGDYRVVYVFDKSEFKKYGVDRGWKIISVNGSTVNYTVNIFNLMGEDNVGVSNTFVFEDLVGELHTITTKKNTLAMNTVIHQQIFDVDGVKTAYLVFNSFIEPAKAELDSIFGKFKKAGVQNLILDLRYNGGGRTDVTTYLAGLIAGKAHSGKILLSYTFNAKYSNENKNELIPKQANAIDLKKLIFIGSRGTASASEALINGLAPFMDVALVGDTTYGKPAGMVTIPYENYDVVLVPIAFKLTNSEGYGDYFGGLIPNALANDDINQPFGSPNEDMFAQALYYLQYGVPKPMLKSSSNKTKYPMLDRKGLKFEIGAL